MSNWSHIKAISYFNWFDLHLNTFLRDCESIRFLPGCARVDSSKWYFSGLALFVCNWDWIDKTNMLANSCQPIHSAVKLSMHAILGYVKTSVWQTFSIKLFGSVKETDAKQKNGTENVDGREWKKNWEFSCSVNCNATCVYALIISSHVWSSSFIKRAIAFVVVAVLKSIE